MCSPHHELVPYEFDPWEHLIPSILLGRPPCTPSDALPSASPTAGAPELYIIQRRAQIS